MNPISVMVVDDSALMRNLISRIFEQVDDLTVCGTAMNGRFALDKLGRLKPDVIVLDLEMPDVNGIDFLNERKKRGITIPTIILSSVAERGARITMDALSLGAADFIMKPSGRSGANMQEVAEQLVEMARAYGGEYRKKHPNAAAPQSGRSGSAVGRGVAAERAAAAAERASSAAERAAAAAERQEPAPEAEIEAPVLPIRTTNPAKGLPERTPKREPGPIRLIAIGISTGGPNALRRMLPELDPEGRLAIVIVQHMPAGFTTEFAKSLDRICTHEVREAHDGDVVRAGRILIAPGNRHMRVEKRSLAAVVRISDDELISGHRPSADALFGSVAQVYGHECLAAIMTGMGRDGAREIGSIYEAGGLTVGQDEESSVVYGMPRAAFAAGYLHHQIPLCDMARFMNEAAAELQEN